MERSVREILYDALRDLTEEQFKDFKWKLRVCNYEGQGTIPWGELEAADRRVVVDLLYGCYGEDNTCISVSLEVLGRINARSVAGKVQRVLELTPRATAEDYRLEYRNDLKEKFQTMKDQNSLPGEFVLLKERYSKLIILDHHRPEKEREHEIMTSGWKHNQVMRDRDSCSITIQTLFQPDKSGLIPDIVVLQGAAGIGKTMTARKIMLDWACGELYPDLFDYVFYIHCRGMNFGTEEKSLADVILRQGANKDAIKGMLRNPQKLLFVIDGFDELRFSIDQPEDCLCSNPWKKASTSVLLSSLFRKTLLPKSRLIITTRPTALEKLHLLLGRSRYAEILGFSPEDRREYFHRFFPNKEQAEKAFRVVKQNETLFTMCFVPITCWIICTVMKQQLDRGEDLVQSSNTVTAIYMLYLSSLFKPSKNHGKELVQRNLRGLCSLAADGIWKREILFCEEEIQKYGLDQEDSLPLFLNENIFKRDLECICTFSFIHLSFQEFFAALSYVLEEEDSLSPYQDVATLLEIYSTSRHDLALTVRFLFGLVNEEQRMRDLKKKFGWKISPKIKELLLQWVKNVTKTGILCNKEILQDKRISCLSGIPEVGCLLYETQDQDFLKSSLDHVTSIELDAFYITDMDIVSTSFCLKNCHNLEILDIEWKHRLSYFTLTADGCEELSRVLITNQTLVHLDLSENTLEDSGTKRLCEALRHPDCKLQSLSLFNCNIKAASWRDLSSVLSTNQNLTNLLLYYNELRDSGLKLLCEGLKHPNCRLERISEYLRLSTCKLTAGCCKELSQVLITNHTLVNLDLSENKLGNSGTEQLCEALRHPACQLQNLNLENCYISAASCGYLSSVFSTNQNLMALHLSKNKLRDSGLKLLCKGLKHPDCRLQTIGFDGCQLTATCCEDLSSVLCSNQSLEKLDLSGNKLGDRGMKLLCGALKHPSSHLQQLWLRDCELSSACCEDLSSALSTNQTLSNLELGGNELGDLGLKLLCDGLKHPNCRLQKLGLYSCGLSEACCEDLASVLSTNQTLTDLVLNDNPLGDSGLRLLCKGLKHPNCSLQKLSLSLCRLTGACCGDLASLLSTSQRLTDLSLYDLELGESETSILREGLKHPNCKLQNLFIFTKRGIERKNSF
ncbi:NACHT, LRR and PYD domains-containing protein 12-like [Tiliqua scincoides]|uniref:NACHT, LRR and PYD domains-containing protein 12-like n=1 Tax=Tiliqua scincoides TaxID=71010 RepID=UPI00346184CF